MKPLRRHQLVWLDEFGWYRTLATAASSTSLSGQPTAVAAQALDCLEHWAEQRWPLVVTRQPVEPAARASDLHLALGLAAPARWGRQAIGVSASVRDVARQDEFPLLAALVPSLPVAAQAGARLLCERFALLGVVARAYGSYGWQQVTGLEYVHPRSDLDLLLEVATGAQADQTCAHLRDARLGPLRIDGELAFGEGGSVAWREWLRFRCGETDRVLVKRIASTTLEDAAAWVETT
jgi:phosphoribosyl-dephospho-CoA transferase